MIEYMLADVITHTFNKEVGKNQHDSRKALHIGFRMNIGNSTDQYRIIHLYLFAPMNYVHVAVLEETIDEAGDRQVKPMEHLCYHDSCWRESIQSWIFKNRGELGGFQSLLTLFDWYDVIVLTPDEVECLEQLNTIRYGKNFGTDVDKKNATEKLQNNPFNNRSVWVKQT